MANEIEKLRSSNSSSRQVKRVVSQEKMNEIIDDVKGRYPIDIFREVTVGETYNYSKKVQKYITRVSASMARHTCETIKKELEEYFSDDSGGVNCKITAGKNVNSSELSDFPKEEEANMIFGGGIDKRLKNKYVGKVMNVSTGEVICRVYGETLGRMRVRKFLIASVLSLRAKIQWKETKKNKNHAAWCDNKYAVEICEENSKGKFLSVHLDGTYTPVLFNEEKEAKGHKDIIKKVHPEWKMNVAKVKIEITIMPFST